MFKGMGSRLTGSGGDALATSPAHPERRGFIRGLGVAAAGAVAATALGSNGAGFNVAAAADLDIAVLQFALNLEYLEAEFYLLAAQGAGLSLDDSGPNRGTVIGGHEVPFKTPLIKAYAREIAREEMRHVMFLRAALQQAGALIPRPNIDFTNSFRTLGDLTGLSTNFDPFADETQFLLASYVFEDVGVTAYHGAAPLLTNKAYLDKAAGILAVEAYHAGLIRTVLFANGMQSETQAISNLRATLDGTYNTQNLDDYGVGTIHDPTIVTCSNIQNGALLGGFPNPPPGNNAIAFDRTPRQVLNIVYGGVNATQGLFFPNGLNGAITK